MERNLVFDFTVNKEAKTVYITREFVADQSLVWDAFTQHQILDQWWAPPPMISKTKYMNFEVGGKRFYAMVSLEGQERWAIQEYLSITPKSHFKMYNTFADEAENKELPGSEWDFYFSEQDGITSVKITVFNASFERMESLLEGFRHGFTITLKNLETLLSTYKNNN